MTPATPRPTLLTRPTRWRRLGMPLAVALAAGSMILTACSGSAVTSGDTESPAATTPGSTDASSAPATGSAPSGDPIKLGMGTALSGAIALFGQANKNAAELAVKQLNEQGGVLGRPVQITVRDAQARPEEGAKIARDLITNEKVDALLGPVSSAVALAVSQVAKENKIPVLFHTSNTEALTVEQFHPYMASVVPNTGMEAKAQGVDLAKSQYTKWATISPNYEFGQRQTGTFVDVMKKNNPKVNIVAQQWPELGETDFQSFIAALLAAEPEAIYSPLYAGDLITFTRQANNLGLFEQVYFTALYETDALRELGDQVNLDGVRAYSRCPFNIDTPQMKKFVEDYKAEYNTVPSDWACMAYDAVLLWAQVSEEAGSLDGEAFAKTVNDFKFTSLRGETAIRAVDHQAAVSSYIGTLKLDEELGMYVYNDIVEVPAEEIWLTPEEVEERRAK